METVYFSMQQLALSSEESCSPDFGGEGQLKLLCLWADSLTWQLELPCSLFLLVWSCVELSCWRNGFLEDPFSCCGNSRVSRILLWCSPCAPTVTWLYSQDQGVPWCIHSSPRASRTSLLIIVLERHLPNYRWRQCHFFYLVFISSHLHLTWRDFAHASPTEKPVASSTGQADLSTVVQ